MTPATSVLLSSRAVHDPASTLLFGAAMLAAAAALRRAESADKTRG